MRESFNNALAPGTIKNQQNQAALYIRFMLLYNFDYLSPTITNIAMYSRFLANSYTSPNTSNTSIKNYMSGAKNWVNHHIGDTQAFISHEINTLVKSYVSKYSHVPSKAVPLTPADITVICKFLDNDLTIPLAVKPAILIAYSAMLRVLNILSPSLLSWGGPHTLQAADIIDLRGSIRLVIRSTKTLHGPTPALVDILPSENPSTCPVRAWYLYKNIINPCPIGPAFITGKGLPLTTSPVVAIMRLALKNAGHPDPGALSFHSLRRGGAQTAVSNGASKEEVMQHGLWRSKSGLAAYLPKNPQPVPRIIARSLAAKTAEDILP